MRRRLDSIAAIACALFTIVMPACKSNARVPVSDPWAVVQPLDNEWRAYWADCRDAKLLYSRKAGAAKYVSSHMSNMEFSAVYGLLATNEPRARDDAVQWMVDPVLIWLCKNNDVDGITNLFRYYCPRSVQLGVAIEWWLASDARDLGAATAFGSLFRAYESSCNDDARATIVLALRAAWNSMGWSECKDSNEMVSKFGKWYAANRSSLWCPRGTDDDAEQGPIFIIR